MYPSWRTDGRSPSRLVPAWRVVDDQHTGEGARAERPGKIGADLVVAVPVMVTVSASSPSYTSILHPRSGGGDRTESGHRQEVSHADARARERTAGSSIAALALRTTPRHPPWTEPVVHADNVAVGVDEHDIEGKAHEEHVDGAAGRRQRPESAASSLLPIRPMKRCQGLSAMVTAPATVVPAGRRQAEVLLCRGHARDPTRRFAPSPSSLGRRAAVRDGDADLGPEPETAAHLHPAADQRGTLAHLDQAEPCGAARAVRRWRRRRSRRRRPSPRRRPSRGRNEMIVSTRCGRPWASALSIACSRIRYVVISASVRHPALAAEDVQQHVPARRPCRR